MLENSTLHDLHNIICLGLFISRHWNTDNGLSEIVGQMEAKNVQIHHGVFGACVTLSVKTMSECYYIGYLLHINNVGFY